MLKMKFKINDHGLEKKLNRLAKDIKDLKQPLKQSGIYMEGKTARRFKAGGTPIKWKPLSPATIRRRRKKSNKPLLDTGRLMQSVTSDPTSLYRLTNTYLKMGTTLKYAPVQQFGGGHVPARPFLYIDNQDERKIEIIFEKWVKQIAKGIIN